MSCYFIARIAVEDPAEYEKYLAAVDDVFSRFNGRYLAVDEHPEALEGVWDHGRVVLIEFPNEADLKAWYYSDAYQGILKHRLNAARCDALIVRGPRQGSR